MEIEHNYDRESELKAFDDTKAGVKGLVDSGITKVPRIFYQSFDQNYPDKSVVRVPTIDLADMEKDSVHRKQIVSEVRAAMQTWGFFQVVNHGVPLSVVDEILECTRRFFEQDTEAKKEFFTRDPSRPVRYNSSFDLFRVKSATWRDSVFCSMAPDPPNPNDMPIVFRDILFEYSKHVSKLGIVLFELLSEALGLNRDFLREMGCANGHCFISHYSPPCPEPNLTLCTKKHSDGCILTVLLQDLVGGLQVLHQNQWVDVDPIFGAFVVNIGDLLQVMSNDKFISVEHRVLASHKGPRVSVACFFRPNLSDYMSSKAFGPIKELITEDDPSKYKETTMKDFASYYSTKGPNGPSAMANFRL